MTPDHVNGAFITAWGLWNLYYYPSLDQPWSFYGGVALVCVNTTYLCCVLIFREGRHNSD